MIIRGIKSGKAHVIDDRPPAVEPMDFGRFLVHSQQDVYVRHVTKLV